MISIRKNKNAIDFTHQTDLALQSRSCRMYSVMQRDMEYMEFQKGTRATQKQMVLIQVYSEI